MRQSTSRLRVVFKLLLQLIFDVGVPLGRGDLLADFLEALFLDPQLLEQF